MLLDPTVTQYALSKDKNRQSTVLTVFSAVVRYRSIPIP